MATPYWLQVGQAAARDLVTRTDDVEDALLHGRPADTTGRRHRPDPRQPPLDLGVLDLDVRLDRRSRDLTWLLVDLAKLPSPPISATARQRFEWIAQHLHLAPPGKSTQRLVDELVMAAAHATRTLGLNTPPKRLDARCPACGYRSLIANPVDWTATCTNPPCTRDDGTPHSYRVADLPEAVVATTGATTAYDGT